MLQLERGATVLGTTDPALIPLMAPFPSYGKARDFNLTARYSPASALPSHTQECETLSKL